MELPIASCRPHGMKDTTAQCKANGVYSRAAPSRMAEDVSEKQRAREEVLKAEVARREALPRPEGACDVTWCRSVASRIWYRTAAEVAANKKSKVKLLPEFRACAAHAALWREWLPVGCSRPAEPVGERARAAAGKVTRLHCPTCHCEA